MLGQIIVSIFVGIYFAVMTHYFLKCVEFYREKKKREYAQQENFDYKFYKLCSQVEQIIDFLNDNECSVNDDD